MLAGPRRSAVFPAWPCQSRSSVDHARVHRRGPRQRVVRDDTSRGAAVDVESGLDDGLAVPFFLVPWTSRGRADDRRDERVVRTWLSRSGGACDRRLRQRDRGLIACAARLAMPCALRRLRGAPGGRSSRCWQRHAASRRHLRSLGGRAPPIPADVDDHRRVHRDQPRRGDRCGVPNSARRVLGLRLRGRWDVAPSRQRRPFAGTMPSWPGLRPPWMPKHRLSCPRAGVPRAAQVTTP